MVRPSRSSRAAAVLLCVATGIGVAMATVIGFQVKKPTPVAGFRVPNTYPHDRQAFTQGLQYIDGVLYEGTGQNGQSGIRKVKLETGEVLQRQPLDARYFGEGITVWRDTIVQLTWQSEIGFVYDKA